MKKFFLCLIVVNVCLQLAAKAQSYVPERSNDKIKIRSVAGVDAYAFGLKDVQLLDGPFRVAMEADAKYLLSIEPDRLLSDFRAHAGLKPKAERYGGWESSGLAGHTLGHYLSACSMHYASSGDTAFLNRVNYVISELAVCQRARSTGYVGAIPKEDSMWAEVKAGHIHSGGFDLNGGWSPWYTVHKIMAGILDAYLYCNNKAALDIETKMADWAGNTIGSLNDSLLQKMLRCEYGGMNEVLANTYAFTGNKKYLDLSYKFHDKRILDSLAMQFDVLPGKHSNTQIPKIIGCARRYELTGDKKDSLIAEFFWNTVVHDHSYATGGNSNYEYIGPEKQLNDRLTDNTTETCNTYNMLKLTRHLFALDPSAALMDYYERALYNHILASQNHSDGMMCYFIPLRMGTKKEYSDPFNTFTCCVGTGMENHVKYNESIYFEGRDGSLFVNLFIPSVLNWKSKGVKIKQETALPADRKVSLLISAKRPVSFPLRIRKPSWAKTDIEVKVNGTPLKQITLDRYGYIVLNRKWKDGDAVTIQLPLTAYTVSMPDNPNRVALFYGPVLLAGIFGDKEPDPVRGIPVLVTTSQDANQWVKRTNNGLVFTTDGIGRPGDVKMIPFNQTQNEYYSVYWDVFTPQGWTAEQKKYEQERLRAKELEARTVDILRLGEMQPERDHHFMGERLNNGEEHGKKWRASGHHGYMAFDMKIDPASSNSLILQYWGSDYRDRVFDIVVDGQTIATENLGKFKASKFYEISYLLPDELTKGKTTVNVKLQPRKENNAVGPIYGSVRMVREK